MRRRFFVDRFTGHTARIDGASAQHLSRVLRAQPGQLYELSDGQAVVLARIERVDREAVEFAVLEPVATRAATVAAQLLVAVVKFDHFEWALEKATELGADVIVPLAAERSERALLAAAAKRADRWRRILLESAQQARCLRVPVLEPLARPSDAFRSCTAGIRVLLSERPGAARLRSAVESQSSAAVDGGKSFCLAIGPEGGWTDDEFSAAHAAGFVEASIGDRVLRTETAVVAGLAAMHLSCDA